MNLNLILRNKRWIILDLHVRVSTLNFFNLFQTFSKGQVSKLVDLFSFTVYFCRWAFDDDLKKKNEEVLWIYLLKTGDSSQKKEEKDVEASSSSLRYILIETSKINRSFFVFSLFVSVISLVLSSILLLLTSSSLWSHRFVPWRIRCWNCRDFCSMMKIQFESLRTA
jgi:hypothetical protein